MFWLVYLHSFSDFKLDNKAVVFQYKSMHERAWGVQQCVYEDGSWFSKKICDSHNKSLLWGMTSGISQVFIKMKEDKNLKVTKFFNWVHLYHVITGDWFVDASFGGGTTLTLGSTPSWEKLTTGSWLCDCCSGDKPFGWTTDVSEGICDIVRDWNKW